MSATKRWLTTEDNENVAAASIVANTGDGSACSAVLFLMQLVSDDDELNQRDVAKGETETGQSSGAAAAPPPSYSGAAEHLCEVGDIAEREVWHAPGKESTRT